MNYRLLLHSADATYDEIKKSYSFVLDQRISRPVSVKVVKGHYANASGATHPLVV